MTNVRVILLAAFVDALVAGGLLAYVFLRTWAHGEEGGAALCMLLSLLLSLGAVGASIWAARRERIGWFVAVASFIVLLSSFYSLSLLP